MKVKTIIGIGILTIILAFFAMKNKESILCPYCKHLFTIVEVGKTDRSELKTNWLGCSHCKRIFSYTWDGEVEIGLKSSYDSEGNFHAEAAKLK